MRSTSLPCLPRSSRGSGRSWCSPIGWARSSRSSRPRDFTNLLSVKLHTSEGETWIEGTVFEPGRPRVALIDGVEVEAPLEGTLFVIYNEDQPGVIGEVGTILGRQRINIADFALGRGRDSAVGVVKVDIPAGEDT